MMPNSGGENSNQSNGPTTEQDLEHRIKDRREEVEKNDFELKKVSAENVKLQKSKKLVERERDELRAMLNIPARWPVTCEASLETVIPQEPIDAVDEINDEDLSMPEQTATATGPMEEVRSLQALFTCKVCLENAVGTISLSCGHLVCCCGHSTDTDFCPLCRRQVNGTVQANFR